MKPMKKLVIQNESFEVVDETARNEVATKASAADVDVLSGRIDNFIDDSVHSEVTTLWTGKMDTLNQSVTLSESVANFDFIDIYTSDQHRRVPVSAGYAEMHVANLSDDASANFLHVGEIRVSFSGTTATLSKATAWIWTPASSSNPTVDHQVVQDIVRIDGVKIASGSADPELVDIRAGADGKTYSSAGDSVRGQISDLHDEIDDIVEVVEDDSVVLDQITQNTQEFTVYEGKSLNSGGSMYDATGWNTYVLRATKDFYIWENDDNLSSMSQTLFLCVYDISDRLIGSRMKRSIDGGVVTETALPQASSKMEIKSGQSIAVAIRTNVVTAFVFDTDGFVEKQDNYKLTQYVSLDDKQVEQVIDAITGGSVKVTTSANTITIKGTNYEVVLSKLTTAQGFEWNITSLKGKGNNVISTGTDVIGVLQFQGADNFMGGLHGNESCYEFDVFAQGQSLLNASGSYDEIHLIMNSHLYDVDDPTQNVVDRFVEMVFTPNGWTSRVTFKVLVSAIVQNAYCSGLFGFNKADASGCYTNIGTLDMTNENRQFENQSFKEVTINLTDNITINMSSETSDDGWVNYRSANQSYKVYFRNWHLQSVSAGDIITGKCEYKIS